MQERVMLERAPIAAVEAVAADEADAPAMSFSPPVARKEQAPVGYRLPSSEKRRRLR